MPKPMTLAKRCAGDDILAVVQSLRVDPPLTSGPESKKLLRMLGKSTCPEGLLLWAAMYGSLEMKCAVANNPVASLDIVSTLFMDAVAAPWYVISLLGRDDIFRSFVTDVFSVSPGLSEAESLELLIQQRHSQGLDKKWESYIPKQGSSKVLQAELVRILWRFGRTLNYCVAYKLDYDDEMFLTLNAALDLLENISFTSKCILRACLRWSQLIQRGGSVKVPDGGYERYDLVEVPVSAFLLHMQDPLPFQATY